MYNKFGKNDNYDILYGIDISEFVSLKGASNAPIK